MDYLKKQDRLKRQPTNRLLDHAMIRRYCLFLFTLFAVIGTANAQTKSSDCTIAFDEVDPFDSLRVVGAGPVIIGNKMLSLYEEANGPRLVPEGKIASLYHELDSLDLLFLVIVLPEYDYKKVADGFNVKFLLQNDSIIGLPTYPDDGYFDRTTNMRHYQHTSLVPLDTYYLLTTVGIKLVRVEYPEHRRTIALSAQQQQQVMAMLRCIGERVGWYPLTP